MYGPNISIPVPADHLDFQIICFDSDHQEIKDNIIVTTDINFRLKMRDMYLDGSPECIKTQFNFNWCGLNLVSSVNNKTPTQLFTFKYTS